MITEAHDDFLRRVTVRIETRIEGENSVLGSGVLYKSDHSPEHVYVFTALHCIYGFDEKKRPFKYNDSQISQIIIRNEHDDFPELVFSFQTIELVKSEEHDFAAFMIPRSNLQQVFAALPSMMLIDKGYAERSYTFRGYPKAYHNTKPHSLKAISHGDKDRNTFEIEATNFLADVTGKEATETTSGYSGSGVFIANTRYLAGILTELKSESGIFNALYCSKLGFIQELFPEIPFYPQNVTCVSPDMWRDKGAFLYKKWAEQGDVRTPQNFVTDRTREEIINELRQSLRNPNIRKPIFRITGLPGLGKTRLVFEAFSPDDLSYKVIYTRAESLKNSTLLDTLQRDQYIHAILVIDDCSLADHQFFENQVISYLSRLSLITLSYENLTISDHQLSSLSHDKIGEILKKEEFESFPDKHLPDAVIKRLANFADGYPSLAILLAKNINDQSCQDLLQADYSELMNRFIAGHLDINSEWFRKTKRVLRGLSLFEKVGYKGRFTQQARWIAASDAVRVNASWNEFQEIIHEQQQRNIVQGEYYLNVSPFPLAIHLVREWWEIHGGDTYFVTLFQNLPHEFKAEMLNFFAARIPFITAVKQGKEFTQNLLSEYGMFADGSFLRTSVGTEFFVKITEADPVLALKYLKNLIRQTNHEERRKFFTDQGTCKWKILYSLQFIAIWKELFEDAVLLLFEIGQVEDQKPQKYGAIEAFAEFFEPAHKEYGDNRPEHDKARTAASPLERFPVLKKALQTDSAVGKTLALKAFRSALKPRNFSSTSSIISGYQGSKRLPTLWEPTGWDDPEIIRYLQQVWTYLDENLDAFDEQFRNEAVNVLLDSSVEIAIVYPELRDMLFQTLLKRTSCYWMNREKLIKAVRDINYSTGRTMEAEEFSKWQDLEKNVTGTSYGEQLKRFIGMELEEGFFHDRLSSPEKWKQEKRTVIQEKIQTLAQQAIAAPKKLEPEYSWLLTGTARQIHFGYELGKRDENFTLLHEFINNQRKAGIHDKCDFLRGYFAVLSEKAPSLWQQSIEAFSKDDILKAYVPILLPVTDQTVQDLLSSVKQGKFPIEVFKILKYREAIKQLSEPVFQNLLVLLLEEQTGSVAIIAFDLYDFYYIYHETDKLLPKDLTLTLLLHSVFWKEYQRVPRNRGFDCIWKSIANKLVVQFPEVEEQLVEQVLEFFGNENSITSSRDYNDIEEFLSESAKRNPKKVWKQVKQHLTSLRSKKAYLLGTWLGGKLDFKVGALVVFDTEDIWEWVEEVEEEILPKARYLATFVTPILFHAEDKICFAREVLAKYGGDEEVRENFSHNCLLRGCSLEGGLSNFQEKEMDPNVLKWIEDFMEKIERQNVYDKIERERGRFIM